MLTPALHLLRPSPEVDLSPARAIWKANLDLGPLRIPVKLYAAAQDRRIHFRLLHAEDRTPVRQEMVDPRTGGRVPEADVQWGMETVDGALVRLGAAELEAAEPPASREIEILRFVPHEAIDMAWFERPYFLGPDGSAKDCAALVAALQSADRYGVARWVMRGKQYFGALGSREDQLQLVALHPAAEVYSAREAPLPAVTAASAAERKLAEQLIAMLDAPFDPGELRDAHRERLEKLIAAKRNGRRYRVEEALPRRSSGELDAALRRSIRAVKGRRRAA